MGRWAPKTDGDLEEGKTEEGWVQSIVIHSALLTNCLEEHKTIKIIERPKSAQFEFVNYIEIPRKHGARVQRVIKSHAMLDYRKREREKKKECKGNLVSIVRNTS